MRKAAYTPKKLIYSPYCVRFADTLLKKPPYGG